jgi:hypothetical protein
MAAALMDAQPQATVDALRVMAAGVPRRAAMVAVRRTADHRTEARRMADRLMAVDRTVVAEAITADKIALELFQRSDAA